MKIIIPFLLLLFLPFLIADQAFAVDCSPTNRCYDLRNSKSAMDIPGGPPKDTPYTGCACDALGQYGAISCVGACGGTYMVTYCADFGTSYRSCEMTYPENDPAKAPSSCTKSCQPQTLIGGIFGRIVPPPAIQKFGPGAEGISKFLSNGVVLFYTIAAIALIFMLLWGAFDWMVSGGDKEKLAAAQRKIINAIIGILLFAAAFAIIQVLGTFTGFTFFAGQK